MGVDGEVFDFIIVDILMWVDLEMFFEIGDNVIFIIDWNYCLFEILWVGGCGGVECFDDYEYLGGDCIF